jgi:hypothetical protein
MSSTITVSAEVRPSLVKPAVARPAGRIIARPKTDWRVVILVNLVSLALHGLVLGICALIVFDRQTFEEIFTTLAVTEEMENEPIIEQAPVQPEELKNDLVDAIVTSTVSDLVAEKTSPAEIDIDDLEPTVVPEDFGLAGPNIKAGDHFAGRSAAVKAALVKQFGGNSASEAAVASGLKWLARRQLKDGSWSFDHTECKECQEGGCSQPGALKECYNGATAFALLAFLGGGHTHQKGDYQKVVKQGLDALLRRGRMTPEGLDLRGRVVANEGMYVQGIATIALCETAALTKDSRYSKPAYQAVRFILAAQDPKGGGWRYDVRQPGDTSVVGWQVMALKSAQNGKIKVPSSAFKLVDKFLDSVQGEKGALYGYTSAPRTSSEASPTLTSVGLLCRMYMGWDQKTPALEKGVAYLDQMKPSPNNMYYNYYATQVLHHWGGEEWKRWNEVMRDHLVRTQVKEGPEAGSWDLTDPHGGAGGRLYQTCLAIMTLEVYYRHLPIYHRDKLKVEY